MAKGFLLKKENYTVVADFMLVSFERDLADFTKVFKTIDVAYLEAFKEANQIVKKTITAHGKKQEQKNTTQSLYATADGFREKLLLLKIYVQRANIEVPLLQETIIAFKRKNIEKAVKNTRDMLPILTQNAAKIEDMPSDFLDDIPQILVEMENKNTEQNTLMNEGKEVSQNEKIVYEALYRYISEVASMGKILYKNSLKKDEYTISRILKKMEAN